MNDQNTKQEPLKEAIELLKIAKCPDCSGIGFYYVGNIFPEPQQCQFCFERNKLITPASTPADAPTGEAGEAGELAKVAAEEQEVRSLCDGTIYKAVRAEFAREQARTIATLRAECEGLREEIAEMKAAVLLVKPITELGIKMFNRGRNKQ